MYKGRHGGGKGRGCRKGESLPLRAARNMNIMSEVTSSTPERTIMVRPTGKTMASSIRRIPALFCISHVLPATTLVTGEREQEAKEEGRRAISQGAMPPRTARGEERA
jgi:hypothetical protein